MGGFSNGGLGASYVAFRRPEDTWAPRFPLALIDLTKDWHL